MLFGSSEFGSWCFLLQIIPSIHCDSIHIQLKVQMWTRGKAGTGATWATTGEGDHVSCLDQIPFCDEELRDVAVDRDEAIVMFDRDGVKPEAIVDDGLHDTGSGGKNFRTLARADIGSIMGEAEAFLVRRIAEARRDTKARDDRPHETNSVLTSVQVPTERLCTSLCLPDLIE